MNGAAEKKKEARVAFVTGASRGLGRGLAEALGRRGMAVVLTASGPDVEAVAEELAARIKGGRFLGLTCDVRDLASVEVAAARARDHFGRLDLWVNNAGLALGGRRLAELSADDMRRMVEINILGVMHGAQVAAAHLRDAGGAIYNIHGAGSDGKPVPGMIGYATTKRAVQFFTKAFAAEMSDTKVLVGGISPGLVMTEGFFREHGRTPPELRAVREKTVNLIGDSVETVARWAARIMATNMQTGREFRWLTPGKIRKRAAQPPPRDILAAYRDSAGRLPFPKSDA